LILQIVKKDTRDMTALTKRESRFWDTFIVDALIANFDRHAGNWGYLVNIVTGDIKNAPVYDCGASLFARLDEDKLEEVLNDPVEMHNRIFSYPRSAIQNNNTKINYHDFITSLNNKKCNDALTRIYPRIDLDKIQRIVDSTPTISISRKRFYSEIISARYINILRKAYEKLTSYS
jgi:hypothetical protein